jgi:hypothetical protein
VVVRISATVGRIWPWVTRRMLARPVSNRAPVSEDRVATKPFCCGLGWLGRVMPGSGAILRHVASRAACPSTRCSPAVLTAAVVPLRRASCPDGYSRSPADRTFTTKSRSASVSGPYGIAVVNKHYDDWFLFHELRWTVESRKGPDAGAVHRHHTAEYAEVSAAGLVCAHIGHGTDRIRLG